MKTVTRILRALEACGSKVSQYARMKGTPEQVWKRARDYDKEWLAETLFSERPHDDFCGSCAARDGRKVWRPTWRQVRARLVKRGLLRRLPKRRAA